MDRRFPTGPTQGEHLLHPRLSHQQALIRIVWHPLCLGYNRRGCQEEVEEVD